MACACTFQLLLQDIICSVSSCAGPSLLNDALLLALQAPPFGKNPKPFHLCKLTIVQLDGAQLDGTAGNVTCGCDI